MKLQHIGMLLLSLGVGAGCATSARIPPEQIARSEASIQSAEQIGAARDPRAALHVKYARDQLAAARALAAHGHGDEAQRLLVRSTADADLGLTLARADSARTAAQQATDQVRMLEKELNKATAAPPSAPAAPPAASEPGTTGTSGTPAIPPKDQPEPAPRDPD
jgi:hypothetical protein